MDRGFVSNGSSPHTRGARDPQGRPSALHRIIPAYAGSTGVGLVISAIPPDHPRIRGEHERVRDVRGARAGSSPHTRGAPSNDSDYPERQWIIPAYAGSTPRCTNARSSRRDHPRIRGEHDPGCLRPGVSGGSSPHTRGAPGGFSEACSDARIIPAYAGSTLRHRCLLSRLVGSSPHTRGAHTVLLDRIPLARIIPAYAGSTSPGTGSAAPETDHPRIRGEHPCQSLRRSSAAGSSPHTRGAPSAEPGSRPITTDHPRIRGEHPIAAKPDNLVMGSSPHTRGARRRPFRPRGRRGIIPAYAGST